MKRKIMIITVLASVAAVYALLSFMGIGRQFIIKDDDLIAATANLNDIFFAEDSEDVFNVKLTEMTDYFTVNDINTVIIPYNEGREAVSATGGFTSKYGQIMYFENEDILLSVKKPLEKAGVQIVLNIDCSEIAEEEIPDIIEAINKRYHFAGVMLSNCGYSNETLQSIKMKINRRMRNYYFGLHTDDIEKAKQLQGYGAIDFYVFENITDTQYKELKNGDFASAKILLSHKSESFEKDLFILSNFADTDGAVLTDYTDPNTDLSFYHNLMDTSEGLARFNMTVDNTFAISYPSKDISTYYDGIYVAGIANPYEPVYVNGQQAVQGKDGSFGLYVELSEGENLIEVEQGENFAARTVTLKVYEGTGSYRPMESDDTERAYKGQVVQTTGPLTSILSNPDKDEAIMDGIPQGIQLVVEKSVKTTRNGKYTWAYQLSNGGYILAEKVEWVEDEDYTEAELSGISLEDAGDGNEYLALNITGKPAIISSFKNGQVIFTFFNTTLDEKYVQEEEEFFVTDIAGVFTTECYVKQDGKNVVLVLENNTENELWGYNTEYYADDVVKIYLKKAPKKQQGAKPLEGVSIMLDAGHGGTDPGALAMGGIAGPNENDVNLAVTLATQQCLEKLGATVYLTRSDDTFLTLEERRSMVTDIKPDLFISQHHNSLEYTVDVNKSSGVESYYFTPQSASVAEVMAERISTCTGRKNRGYGFGYFYVLRYDIAPAVLNEYGFIINPVEYANIYRDEDIYKAAFATAQAVLDIIPE
ncbi:MAG: N-acetylmuramoyl-L-alanine amidase [Ruminococcaceae bacterium]|nr:N-acetylmuramoyl-L-alanine amidase [Oscillospiraceae bacterium]